MTREIRRVAGKRPAAARRRRESPLDNSRRIAFGVRTVMSLRSIIIAAIIMRPYSGRRRVAV